MAISVKGKIALWVSGTLLVVWGCFAAVYFGLQSLTATITTHHESELTPDLDSANTTYTPEFAQIYDLSTPVMFNYTPEGAQTDRVVCLNGTAWVFDRQIASYSNLTTYYLMTNLHVIDLWDKGIQSKGNTFPALKNVSLYLADKNIYPAFDEKTMVDTKGTPIFKWPYIASNGRGVNYDKWIGSNNVKDYPAIDANQTDFVIGQDKTITPDPEAEIDTPVHNYIEHWDMWPLGLEQGLDYGIIQIQIKNENIKYFPFFRNFDKLIKPSSGPDFVPVQDIYDLSPQAQNNLNLSIGGFPGMKDADYTYSTWTGWDNNNNYQSNANGSIALGNHRADMWYQNIPSDRFPNKNIYTGSAPNANLAPGSSGSLVWNNLTGQIEGVYWGGYIVDDNFVGQFVPFGPNHIIEYWKQTVENHADTTYISSYYNAKKPDPNYKPEMNPTILNQLQDYRWLVPSIDYLTEDHD